MPDFLECCGEPMHKAGPLHSDPTFTPLLRCYECGHYEPDDSECDADAE
ncbi:hypothetical protein ACFWPK_13320 [Nocardia sp. NPDC058519]